jgi:hypothetical protein
MWVYNHLGVLSFIKGSIVRKFGLGPYTLDPWKFKIVYDKLVIALGAQPLTFGTHGVKEHAIFLQEICRNFLLNLMLSDMPGMLLN